MNISPALRAISAVAIALAACSGGSSGTTTSFAPTTTADPGPTFPITTPTTGVVTIPIPTDSLVVWVETEELAAAVEERAAAYTASSGVAVRVEVYQAPATPPVEGETATNLGSALVLDLIEGASDVYLGSHTWAITLAEAGKAEPVFLDADLPASVLAAVSPRGYPLGIPLAVDGIVQVRNRALMPEAPEAVETIPCPDADRCLMLPADGNAEVHHPFLTAMGGYLFGPDPDGGYDTNDLGISNEQSIAGATILADLIAAGTVGTAPDEPAVVTEFATGGVALMWIHAHSIGAARDSGLDLAVETLPTVGGNPAVSAFEVLTAYVDPFGSAKSEALDFATHWLGDVNGSAAMALAWGGAPVWAASADAESAAVLASVTAGLAVPPIADIDRIWFEVGDAFRRIHLGTTPEEAMFGAADDIR